MKPFMWKQEARAGRLDPVIGRDEEIRRTIQILSRRTKNNPVTLYPRMYKAKPPCTQERIQRIREYLSVEFGWRIEVYI
jgi:hypothetical protein